MSPEIAIRLSLPDDIPAVCNTPPPVNVIAFTVTLDGEPVCVAGIMLTPTPIIFSDFKRVNVPKKTIYRTAKILLEKLRGLRIHAITTALTGRSRFLESLGLELACQKDNYYFYRI